MTKYYQIDDQYRDNTETVPRQYCNSNLTVPRQYQDSTAIVPRQYWEITETVPWQYRNSIETVLRQYPDRTETVPRQYWDSGPLQWPPVTAWPERRRREGHSSVYETEQNTASIITVYIIYPSVINCSFLSSRSISKQFIYSTVLHPS